jgi:hypothetical protein
MQIFYGDYLGKTHETTQSRFDQEGTCLGWLSPLNNDSGFTQILARHYGAQSQTVSHHVSSRITPSIKSPQFSPSELLKYLRMGLVQIPHHILTTRMEPRGYIKVVSAKICSTYATWPSPEFSPQTQPWGLHVGHCRGIQGQNCGGYSPTNLTTVSRGGAHSGM